jgi:hypothetical protein
MAAIQHDQLCAWIDGYARHVQSTAEYTVRSVMDVPGVKQLSFSSSSRRAIFSAIASRDVANPNTFITIIGGGAFDVPPSQDLFAQLLDHHRHLDWGGPFARYASPSCITFGSRLTVPSSIFGNDVWDNGSDFLLSMIDVVADNGRALAEQTVPPHGGQRFTGEADQDMVLLAGFMGM